MTNKPTELVVTQADRDAAQAAIFEMDAMVGVYTREAILTDAFAAHRLASTAPASGDEVELDRLAELLANFARDRFANTKELTWATMGEHSQQYFRDAVNVVRAARARKAHQDAIEEAAKVAESFPFSDSAAIAHRIRALIDKEPSE